jgi:histidine triad (HIT) family protein
MCIFCKIVAGEIPNNTVLEDDEFLAFYDIEPQAKTHILVIPKKHFESFEEVDNDTMAKMTEFIKKVSKKADINKNGYRLITNIGSDGGQEVPHLHFHLLGGQKIGKLVS